MIMDAAASVGGASVCNWKMEKALSGQAGKPHTKWGPATVFVWWHWANQLTFIHSTNSICQFPIQVSGCEWVRGSAPCQDGGIFTKCRILRGVKTHLKNIESQSALALSQFSFRPLIISGRKSPLGSRSLCTLRTHAHTVTSGLSGSRGSLGLRDLPTLPHLGEILATFCFHCIFFIVASHFSSTLVTQSFILNVYLNVTKKVYLKKNIFKSDFWNVRMAILWKELSNAESWDGSGQPWWVDRPAWFESQAPSIPSLWHWNPWPTSPTRSSPLVKHLVTGLLWGSCEISWKGTEGLAQEIHLAWGLSYGDFCFIHLLSDGTRIEWTMGWQSADLDLASILPLNVT